MDEINSKISWVQENIGIELEVDLRDFSIYLGVVIVIGFEIPKGYYVFEGVKV